MCGITGIFNYLSRQRVDPEVIFRMCKSVSHRGPDDEGFHIDQESGIALGHRRLSIIDLATGKQPMSNEAGNIWIIFNGEIYNFRELRSELQGKGYRFRTTSDTEVIIYMYEEYGTGSFSRLNGIFAFAIYDKRRRCLVLARDHFGVKPLYYMVANGKLVFASEIKAILQDQTIAPELDYEAVNTFFTFRFNPSPQTLFKGIRKLQPGHYMTVASNGSVELRSYWQYNPVTNSKISENDAILEYQKLLTNAVRRQMVSDVPVGLLLSGGVDSAVVGYLMQEVSHEPIKSFTIGFPGNADYNELDDARTTAEFIGSRHYGMMISQKEYLDFFLRSFSYTEEPIAEPTISALYYVSRLASSHLKVVLAGQGADEPLAGYHRYMGERYISKCGLILRMLPLKSLVALLPRNERFRQAAYAAQFSAELQRFLAIYTVFTPAQKERLFSGKLKGHLRDVDLALVDRLYSQGLELEDSLSRIIFIDTRMSLSDDLLLFGDKITMANSVEMRVPFLDVELVQFLESLPSSLKLRGRTRKYIHKKAAEAWLPKQIIYRKKRGFATPIDEWLQSDLAVAARKAFNAKNSACSMYFNLSFVNEMIEKHQARKRDFKKHLFALLSFEFWHKTFFENHKIAGEMLSYEN
jgi:asparagine synthase (glutamine-hydrolysing)